MADILKLVLVLNNIYFDCDLNNRTYSVFISLFSNRSAMYRRVLKGVFALTEVGKSQKSLSTVFSVPKVSKQTERWNSAVQEAAGLVESGGLGGQHMLQNIIKDQHADQILKRLLSINHPVVQSINQLLYDTRLTYQVHAVVALLFAQMLGHTESLKTDLQPSGISTKQHKLANCLELYRASFVVHTNLLNLSKEKDGDLNPNLVKANGFGVLLGDYLAANGSVTLSSISCNEVLEIVSSGIIDFTKSSFYNEVDKNGNFLPDQNAPLSLWQHIMFLTHASLLAKGCQGMAILGGHQDNVQTTVHDCAKNFALAMKINRDLQIFMSLADLRVGTPFSMELAPVIMHLDKDPQLVRYIRENGKQDINNLDYSRLLDAVKSGNGETKALDLMEGHIAEGLKDLRVISGITTRASELLEEMFHALRIN